MTDIKRLLEIGIAVNDAKSVTRNYSQLFRAPSSDLISDIENFAIRFTMCRVGDVDFEIMETAEANGLIQRFISQRGEGLHHIAFLVDDADALLQQMKRKGVPVLSDRPVRMANLKAFFVHPAYFGGMLLEFVENLHPWLDGKNYIPDPTSPLSDGLLGGSVIGGIVAKVSNPDKTAQAFKLLGAHNFTSADNTDIEQIRCRLGNIDITLVDENTKLPEGHWLCGHSGIRRIDVEVDDPSLCAAKARSSREYRVMQIDETTNALFSPRFHGAAFGLCPRAS